MPTPKELLEMQQGWIRAEQRKAVDDWIAGGMRNVWQPDSPYHALVRPEAGAKLMQAKAWLAERTAARGPFRYIPEIPTVLAPKRRRKGKTK
jgi:head-tail adaptor